ncbi:MAG: carboxypeptidase regulatory-like domain-containing protein [Marinilabiliales bacterium]
MRKSIFILLFILCFQSVFSQSGTVRGFIYDKGNGEPILYANVVLYGAKKYGTASDINGYFSITKIDPGSYKLEVTALGYDTVELQIQIKANAITDQKIYLKERTIQLGTAVVSAERQELKTDIRTSVVKITPKQITQIPTIGSEPDLAQYLQILPGVVFTGDQGGQLYIRGGPPIENKVLLDGMVVYNPFHSIGLFSVFDSDIIKNVDVYTGGFSAEYGGRISSIMDITMRDGNKKKLAGKTSLSPFGAKLLLEGPIVKDSPDRKSSTSFIFSGKTSYLEQSSKLLYTYIDTAGLPFNFTDFYGKISVNGNGGSKINLFGYNFTDQVNYGALSNLNWNSYGVGSNVIIVPSSSPVLIKTKFAYSKYDITLEQSDSKPRNSSIDGFNLGLGFNYFIGSNELNYGFEVLGYKTNFNFYNIIGRHLYQEENTTELAAFIKYKMKLNKLLIEPSFRLQYYASLSYYSPEPRLGIKYNINDYIRIKFAGGFYTQNLVAANSDRDVVNLFYGFLSGPEVGNLQDEFDGKEVTNSLQHSRHGIFGIEYDLSDRILLNAEGYYKQNTQLTNINRNKIYDDTAENYDKPDYLKKDFIIETGDAYGIDFWVKYDYKRTYIWFVYSLGYVTRYDGYIEYAPHFDRRHNINFLMSKTLGADLNWEVSIRWNYGSGFPFTPAQGYYEEFIFDEINTNYTSANGNIGVIYGDLNSARLSDYHRLDFNIKRKFFFVNNSELEISASVTNVYNRNNVFYFNRLTHERVDQLPIMPSIGMSFTF